MYVRERDSDRLVEGAGLCVGALQERNNPSFHMGHTPTPTKSNTPEMNVDFFIAKLSIILV